MVSVNFYLNNLEQPQTIFCVHLEVSSAKMTTSSKLSNLFVQLSLMGIAGFIIFRTVKQVGIVLYTFHPALMAIGVSSLKKY
jgi:hypothetical protein